MSVSSRIIVAIRMALIPAAFATLVVSFLPWYVPDSGTPDHGDPMMRLASAGALAFGVWSLAVRPRATRSGYSLIPSLLTLACASAALLSSARFTKNETDGFVVYGQFYPPGFQAGTVYTAIGASAVMTVSGFVSLYVTWDVLFGSRRPASEITDSSANKAGTASSANSVRRRLPPLALALLLSTILFSILALTAPIGHYKSSNGTDYYFVSDYYFSNAFGAVVALIDVVVMTSLLAAGAVGRVAAVRRLSRLFAVMTAVAVAFYLSRTFTQSAGPIKILPLGFLVPAGAVAFRVASLIALFRRRDPGSQRHGLVIDASNPRQ